MAIDRGDKPQEVDLDELLGELEHRIDRLKVLYEQYFMGIEKIEPQTARKEVARKLLELTQMNIRNTAIRYRFNALNQKWGVYTTYWNRTLREIEKGTYYRNVAKVGREALRKGLDVPEEVLRAMPERMREKILKDRAAVADRAAAKMAEASAKKPDQERFDETFDALFDTLTGRGKSVTVPTPPPEAEPAPVVARPAPKPSLELPPGMTEQAAQELFRRYVAAKRVVGEDTSNVRYEQVVRSLSRQAPKILAEHGARSVDFSVVIKDGRVILKAIPKK